MDFKILNPVGEGAAAVSFLAEDEKGQKVLIKQFKTAVHGKTENRWLIFSYFLRALDIQPGMVPGWVFLYAKKCYAYLEAESMPGKRDFRSSHYSRVGPWALGP